MESPPPSISRNLYRRIEPIRSIHAAGGQAAGDNDVVDCNCNSRNAGRSLSNLRASPLASPSGPRPLNKGEHRGSEPLEELYLYRAADMGAGVRYHLRVSIAQLRDLCLAGRAAIRSPQSHSRPRSTTDVRDRLLLLNIFMVDRLIHVRS